jgi:GNAT superfamily N-acetyltransferase
MTQFEYEIRPYEPELMYQVVNLLHYLWGGRPDVNVSYFKWKYNENPYTESPLGIVALHKDEVIGFRGYFGTKWEILGSELRLVVLCPGDTCVHPDHRRAGLSVAMGNKAIEQYEPQYGVFLSLSATKNSTPGYLKMGFVTLLDKSYLTRYSPLSLLMKKFRLTSDKRTERRKNRIEFGEFGDIIVTNTPRPEEMYSVLGQQGCNGRKIRLHQDEEYFRWRFRNRINRYVFYYHRKADKINAYVVMRILQRGRIGNILDYAEMEESGIERVLRYVIRRKDFDILLIYNLGFSDNFPQLLKHLGFRENSLIRKREIKKRGVWPVMVRPVKRDCDENDWFIGGLDIRDIRNWEIKEICNDGV